MRHGNPIKRAQPPRASHANRGGDLEALIRASAEQGLAQGLYLRHTSPRFVGRILPDGSAKGRFVERGPLDFCGDLRGRAVYLDGKNTKLATRFAFDNLKEHQVYQVRDAARRGAVAFFLVAFSDLKTGPEYYALTWAGLGPHWEATERGFAILDDAVKSPTASIPLAWFREHAVRVPMRGLFLDLVGAITTLIAKEAT